MAYNCLPLPTLGLLALAATSTYAQSSSSPKGGLSLHGDTTDDDYATFLSTKAPISWYYTWSPWPNQFIDQSSKDVEFVPLLHGVDNLADDLRTLQDLSSSAHSDHLLTFNEPDGTTASGGSNIQPRDAAQAYIDQIIPLRKGNGGKWQISHPVVTGSGNGLNWLIEFCAACHDINGNEGCPTDFIAAHWYGDFPGLASWLGQLGEFYRNTSHSFRSQSDSSQLEVWITEFALPQQDDNATEAMMNQSLPYLDGLDEVAKYAWFGLFRENSEDADGWAGSSVALLDNDGGLTELGAMYLGGEQNGFEEGDRKEAKAASLVLDSAIWLICLACAIAWLA